MCPEKGYHFQRKFPEPVSFSAKKLNQLSFVNKNSWVGCCSSLQSKCMNCNLYEKSRIDGNFSVFCTVQYTLGIRQEYWNSVQIPELGRSSPSIHGLLRLTRRTIPIPKSLSHANFLGILGIFNKNTSPFVLIWKYPPGQQQHSNWFFSIYVFYDRLNSLPVWPSNQFIVAHPRRLLPARLQCGIRLLVFQLLI